MRGQHYGRRDRFSHNAPHEEPPRLALNAHKTLTFLKGIYPELLSWHRYHMTYRDPEESGPVTIYHPWGSGTDNSPR